MTGWYNRGSRHQSYRHALAAKGIETKPIISSPIKTVSVPLLILTKLDIMKAKDAAALAVDDKFFDMNKAGDQYEVSSNISEKKYGLLGLAGFAWIKFKGVKEKNALVKAGITVDKSYHGGFEINAKEVMPEPTAKIMGLNKWAGVYYAQSVDLKEIALKAFLKSLQDKGYLKEAYVNTQLD